MTASAPRIPVERVPCVFFQLFFASGNFSRECAVRQNRGSQRSGAFLGTFRKIAADDKRDSVRRSPLAENNICELRTLFRIRFSVTLETAVQNVSRTENRMIRSVEYCEKNRYACRVSRITPSCNSLSVCHTRNSPFSASRKSRLINREFSSSRRVYVYRRFVSRPSISAFSIYSHESIRSA